MDVRTDKRMLDMAGRVALRAAGDAEPNPLVGCVIARDGEVLAIGHHTRFGGLHAEREALAACLAAGHDPRGTTAYVTLEPCRHTGKQPPCTDALIEAGIARVVYACDDPGVVSGGGAGVLREAGVECVRTDASELALRVGQAFVHRERTGRPWVIAKWAQTIDGRIATRFDESKWISGPGSRSRVHRVRARVDAVVTGIGTVLADDPLLTARDVGRVRRVARRVVVDSTGRTPLTSALVRTAGDAPVTVYTAAPASGGPLPPATGSLREAGVEVVGCAQKHGGVHLGHMLEHLMNEHGVSTVLVEAGPRLLGSFFEQGLVDEALVYVAPMLFGDAEARAAVEGVSPARLAAAQRFELCRSRAVGDDVELTYRRPL